jgi:hypothetical protein
MVNIKQAKTRKRDHLHTGKPLIRDKGNPLCPVTALEDYMASAPLARSEDPNQVPLFRHADGSAESGDDLKKFVKLAAEGVGLNPEHFSGHSLRIDGATAALACDSGNEYCVKIMGMWVGDSVAAVHSAHDGDAEEAAVGDDEEEEEDSGNIDDRLG